MGVIVLVAVFYGGMVYGKSQIPARGGNLAFGQNPNGASGMRGARTGGGFTAGKIISKDATSITVQIMAGGPASPSTQGGSKIIFVDNNTKVTKQANGALSDLAVGTDVSVTGTPNADGSISAQSVQIRPNTPPVLK
ncbi:MAG: DUF5666 domain-containing protein [Candidatus Nomurabacteria bacterium]|nr:DUF5666 domain-containing protein [Candidatus Nomurabacteria bacterium]